MDGVFWQCLQASGYRGPESFDRLKAFFIVL
jgi:hypothetical protein